MHPKTECFPPKSCSQGDGQPLKPTEKPGYCFPKASSWGSGRTGKSSSVHAKLSPELRASLTRASYYGLCSGQVSSSGKGAPSQHCREMKCCILSNHTPSQALQSSRLPTGVSGKLWTVSQNTLSSGRSRREKGMLCLGDSFTVLSQSAGLPCDTRLYRCRACLG